MINFENINSDLSNVNKVLKSIRSVISGAKDDISLYGKNIAVANVEQPSLISYYDEIKSELKHLVDYSDLLLKKKKGELYKQILESLSKSLTDRALEKLVDSDDEYITLYRTHLDIKESYDKMVSIVTAFTQRSYSLNNLVKIYENELHNITVYDND